MSESKNSYFDKFSDIGFKQIINENTRITNDSESCIDLIFTNKANNISGFGTLDISFSDHKPIYASRKLNFSAKYNSNGRHNEIKYKDCKNLDLNSLISEV